MGPKRSTLVGYFGELEKECLVSSTIGHYPCAHGFRYAVPENMALCPQLPPFKMTEFPSKAYKIWLKASPQWVAKKVLVQDKDQTDTLPHLAPLARFSQNCARKESGQEVKLVTSSFSTLAEDSSWGRCVHTEAQSTHRVNVTGLKALQMFWRTLGLMDWGK